MSEDPADPAVSRAGAPAHRVIFLHDADVLPGPIGALAELGSRVDLDVPRHPGFGSEWDDRCGEWDSVSDLAHHHLQRIRESGDSRRVHLVGAGLGGWVALEMAVWCRELLASLTLVCPFGVKFSAPTEPEFADILLLDPREIIELGWADPAACSGLRMPGYPPDGDDETDARAFAERGALARYVWKPFLHDPALRRRLRALALPALVLSGDSDRLVRAGHAAQLAAEIPGARHIELPGAGHYPYLETPGAFLQVLLAFLGAREPAAAEGAIG